MNAVIRTPDTDVFVVLLYHAMKLTVYFDKESRKHRRLIILSNLAESLGKDNGASLLGL